jgi:hypothetical protein
MRQVIDKILVLASILGIARPENPIENIPHNLIECMMHRKPHIKPNFSRSSDDSQHSGNNHPHEHRHYTNAELLAFVTHLQSDSPDSSAYDLVSKIGNCAQIMNTLNTILSDLQSQEEI